ncbi:hypothetical protein [uncultured Mucilaginibacter sp.]|uniref:hypothetical protein n=1 Tax=uncultured Mucilaginibacter sp. TaxID=797541 RepID=UPI0025D8B1CF|nr:hypothetical protein [uncultured Mucilaginibacter sp.]
MLNLKELEESLDKALASETYESVTDWFKERDKEKAKTFIGVQGYLSSMGLIRDKNSKSQSSIISSIDLEIPTSTNTSLPLAA